MRSASGRSLWTIRGGHSPLSDPATRIRIMSPTPPPDSCELSAAELNERIRAFWIGPGGHPAVGLSDEQRVEYQRLLDRLDRLRAAERGDVVEAA